jgi:hypothetical protein
MLEGLRLGFVTKSLVGSRGTVNPNGDRSAMGVIFRLSTFLLDTDESVGLLNAQSRIKDGSSSSFEFVVVRAPDHHQLPVSGHRL